MNTQRSGYILVLTMMILSILVVILTSMFFNETSHYALSQTMINREKAKMLALGGVQLAISKLTIKPKKETKKDEKGGKDQGKDQGKGKGKEVKKEETTSKNDLEILKRVFPIINRWQVIKLSEEIDGIDGQIKICICCEEGKINLNNLYDFAKHKFLDENKAIIGQFKADIKKFTEVFSKNVQQITGDKNLIGGLQEFLKKRKYPLNDVTELLEIPTLTYFQKHVFYEPPTGTEKVRPIFLTDIFTIWTDSAKLQPWLFSDSICAIFGLKRTEIGDSAQREKIMKNVFKNFKTNVDWKNDWDNILKPIYQKEVKALEGVVGFFDNQFSAKVFSVISYGTIREITQRIFAIMEIESNGTVKLKKLYWI